MKTKSKVLVLMLSAAALVAASVFGTMAYLTDTDNVTNTFTVGRVEIVLDEADVKTDGTLETNERVQENQYHLLPGHTYIKDPTVTVKAGSEESYVRMMVTVTFKNPLTDSQLATKLEEIFSGYEAEIWNRAAKTVSEERNVITYEYRYYTTADDKSGPNGDGKLEPLFTALTVPGTYTNETIEFLGGMSIVVNAHAIQSDGFDNADLAWAAFDGQYAGKSPTNP